MKSLENTIIELWHISRTALATQSCTRYDRMIYIKRSLIEFYPELIKGMSGKQIWFKIEDQLN
jgi:hypothetical protein